MNGSIFCFYCYPMHFLSVKNLLIPLSSGCISTKNSPIFRKHNYVSGCIKISNILFVRILHSYQKSKYSDRYKCTRTNGNDLSISYLSSFIKFTRNSFFSDTINIKIRSVWPVELYENFKLSYREFICLKIYCFSW